MTLTLRILGVELFALVFGRPPVAKPKPRPAPPAPVDDPTTYITPASSPRPARTEFSADPDPIDRFGFGFATPGGDA